MKYCNKEIGIPTLEQIKEYIIRRKFNVNAIDVYEKYSKRNWLNGKGLPIKTLESMVDSFNGVNVERKTKHSKYYKEPKKDTLVDWARKTNSVLVEKSTICEKDLLHRLKSRFPRLIKFQLPFLINGKLYYADISIPSIKLIIEVDGGYHSTPEQQAKDKKRDEDFKSIGYTTFRYTNKQLEDNKEKQEIVKTIFNYILKNKH
jgi:very-short-patch-repair endonuclease